MENTTIELRSADAGSLVEKTYPDANGAFNISNVAPGQYMLSVTEGGQVVEEQVAVTRFDSDLHITMPRGTKAKVAANQGGRVSVSQLTIPAKAQHAFESAQNSLSKKDIAKATQQVEHALAITPRFPDALSFRAVLYLATGNAAMAIQTANQSAQLDSKNALAYTILGASYNAAGNFRQAAAALQQAFHIDPNFWQSHFEMARCLYNEKKASSALTELDRAARGAPREFAQLHLLRGAILMQLQHSYDASVELRRFLQQDPQSPEAAQAKQMLASLPQTEDVR